MIHLRHDCLVFEGDGGEWVPCSAEEVALDLVVDPSLQLDSSVIKNAAAAVLHYFRNELGRAAVTMQEFSKALVQALQGLGFRVAEPGGAPKEIGELAVKCEWAPSSAPQDTSKSIDCEVPSFPEIPSTFGRREVDLVTMEQRCSLGGELEFFHSLKEDLSRRLEECPEVLIYHGLRTCSKRLCSARRWTERCQEVSDRIVDFLRDGVKAKPGQAHCVLCVF